MSRAISCMVKHARNVSIQDPVIYMMRVMIRLFQWMGLSTAEGATKPCKKELGGTVYFQCWWNRQLTDKEIDEYRVTGVLPKGWKPF